MADTTTLNYAFVKPDVDDPAGENLWGGKLNDNFDNIDAAIKAVSDVANAAALASRNVVAGAGLTGGGDLTADRTFDVGAGSGIVANTNDVAVDKATAANIRAATSNKVVTADGVLSAAAYDALTSGTSVAIDHAAGYNRKLTHAHNVTFGAPSNSKPGFPLNIWLVPGAFTTAWNSVFKFDGSTPSITAECVVCFLCLDSSNFVYLGKRNKA